MRGVDWEGLKGEAVRRTAHILSPTEAALEIGIDRQTLERWREGKPGIRKPNTTRLLKWARDTLTPKELARYGVPPTTSADEDESDDRAVEEEGPDPKKKDPANKKRG